MDSDGNINPRKKIFKRTLAPSAEDIHQKIVTSSDAPNDVDKSEAEAINALAEEVISMIKPHSVSSVENIALETNSHDHPLMEESNLASPSVDGATNISPEEIPTVTEPVVSSELVSESTTPAAPTEPITPVSPEPIASLETSSEAVPVSTTPEPLADVDTIVAPEPILTSDTPAAPISSSPELVTVKFSSTTSVPVTFTSSVSEESADSANPVVSAAPAAPTKPVTPKPDEKDV